ncbi:MAG: aminotransferase class I/II-fold pyridoxal phosphate-dependent enzyme [Thermoanaerobaculia bacterium]|nr:MAG: aminotransferase class I/II-fold pyridoxal phosphate-dependent enzyme [Thermoanaerobaculia bacterium]
MAATTAAPLDLGPPAAPHRGLSRIASTLVGSEILRIGAEVRALQEQGRPVLNLTVGDFSPRQFRIPAQLESGIARALAAGQTNYPPSDGVAELRRAVRDFYHRALALDYPVEAVLVAGGARPVIWAAYQAILDPGDTVVYPVPSWNNNHYAHLTAARAVAVETRPENGFLPTAEELAPHLPGATLLALNSPLNPAGSGFRPAALAAIARLVVEENRRRGPAAKPLFLLYDQIYWLVAAADAPHATPVTLVPEVAPWTVFVDGISKAFAATGLRVGWAVAPPYLASRMGDLLGHVGAWAPKPEQIATAGILADASLALALAATVRDGINVRLAALGRALSGLAAAGLPVSHLPPAGALYLSARFDLLARFADSDGIRRYLLEEAGFAVVPFHAFGAREDRGWFRLSVGAVGVEEIEAATAPLAAALRAAAA